jgi:hypothetical protein
LIFGSGAPRNSIAHELKHLSALWPVEEHTGTYSGNILRLIEEVRA